MAPKKATVSGVIWLLLLAFTAQEMRAENTIKKEAKLDNPQPAPAPVAEKGGDEPHQPHPEAMADWGSPNGGKGSKGFLEDGQKAFSSFTNNKDNKERERESGNGATNILKPVLSGIEAELPIGTKANTNNLGGGFLKGGKGGLPGGLPGGNKGGLPGGGLPGGGLPGGNKGGLPGGGLPGGEITKEKVAQDVATTGFAAATGSVTGGGFSMPGEKKVLDVPELKTVGTPEVKLSKPGPEPQNPFQNGFNGFKPPDFSGGKGQGLPDFKGQGQGLPDFGGNKDRERDRERDGERGRGSGFPDLTGGKGQGLPDLGGNKGRGGDFNPFGGNKEKKEEGKGGGLPGLLGDLGGRRNDLPDLGRGRERERGGQLDPIKGADPPLLFEKPRELLMGRGGGYGPVGYLGGSCTDSLKNKPRDCSIKLNPRDLSDSGDDCRFGREAYVYNPYLNICIGTRFCSESVARRYPFKSMNQCASQCVSLCQPKYAPPPGVIPPPRKPCKATAHKIHTRCHRSHFSTSESDEISLSSRRWAYSRRERTCVQKSVCKDDRSFHYTFKHQLDCLGCLNIQGQDSSEEY